MSVKTKTDELIEEAQVGVQSAITALYRLIIEEPWGWEQLSEDKKNKIHGTLIELRHIKSVLKG